MGGILMEYLEGGFVAPLTNIEFAQPNRPGQFDGGVYYKDGKVCELGKTIKGNYNNIPEAISSNVQNIGSNSVFGGMLQNEHFGHFMAESLSRLWSFENLNNKYNSVTFFLRKPNFPIAKFIHDLFSLIVPGVNLTIAESPIQFDTLVVPQQIVHPGNGFIYGHHLIKNICQKLVEVEPSVLVPSAGCAPARQGARRMLVTDRRPFQLRHEAGALVSVWPPCGGIA